MEAAMQQDALIRFLRSSGHLSMQQAREIAGKFEPRRFSKADFLLVAGGFSDMYCFLVNGLMRAYSVDAFGKEVTTNFYSGPCVVFEADSFFNRKQSMESIVAVVESEGFVIDFEAMNSCFHGYPEFREFGRSILVRGFTALKARMLSTITETAEQRYAALVESRPEILKHVPVKHIATYLGVTDTSLSRIRREYGNR
jgi:CRP-like cAMP-binding protein